MALRGSVYPMYISNICDVILKNHDLYTSLQAENVDTFWVQLQSQPHLKYAFSTLTGPSENEITSCLTEYLQEIGKSDETEKFKLIFAGIPEKIKSQPRNPVASSLPGASSDPAPLGSPSPVSTTGAGAMPAEAYSPPPQVAVPVGGSHLLLMTPPAAATATHRPIQSHASQPHMTLAYFLIIVLCTIIGYFIGSALAPEGSKKPIGQGVGAGAGALLSALLITIRERCRKPIPTAPPITRPARQTSAFPAAVRPYTGDAKPGGPKSDLNALADLRPPHLTIT